jgi:hypothetical protein
VGIRTLQRLYRLLGDSVAPARLAAGARRRGRRSRRYDLRACVDEYEVGDKAENEADADAREHKIAWRAAGGSCPQLTGDKEDRARGKSQESESERHGGLLTWTCMRCGPVWGFSDGTPAGRRV